MKFFLPQIRVIFGHDIINKLFPKGIVRDKIFFHQVSNFIDFYRSTYRFSKLIFTFSTVFEIPGLNRLADGDTLFLAKLS
jgi:hypothetical protein